VEAWAAENAAAISERRAWIVANGMPLADLQVFKVG
jgi:antitoxin CcdA